MPRTTLDIDPTVLDELKKRRRQEGKSIGQIASELLAAALRSPTGQPIPKMRWTTKAMNARVDLEDKEQVCQALDLR
jgi:hypothetical protein